MSLYIASGRSRLERGVMKRLVTLGNPSSSLGQVGVGGVSPSGNSVQVWGVLCLPSWLPSSPNGCFWRKGWIMEWLQTYFFS